jgi:hypothetical protein
MTAPMMPPPRPPAPQDVRIGLWGAPSSGKTTYLAALNLAANRWPGPGNWIMNGVDDESSQFLSRSTDLMTREHAFHVASVTSSNLTFRFTGSAPTTAAAEPRRRWFGRNGDEPPAPPRPIRFELDTLDVPGGAYDVNGLKLNGSSAMQLTSGDTGGVREDIEEQLIDHLELCGGIVYLFDPVRDARKGDAFEFFHRTLERLARRIFEQERYMDTHLPHHIAVCVTKFDHPEIYRAARRYGLTVQYEHPPYLPYVPDQYAYEFFQQLCVDSPNSTADLVRGALSQHFAPERLRVFVTSSIGFYIGDSQRFRPNDCVNTIKADDGEERIRGGVHPINVLEPVLWIQEQLRRSRVVR